MVGRWLVPLGDCCRRNKQGRRWHDTRWCVASVWLVSCGEALCPLLLHDQSALRRRGVVDAAGHGREEVHRRHVKKEGGDGDRAHNFARNHLQSNRENGHLAVKARDPGSAARPRRSYCATPLGAGSQGAYRTSSNICRALTIKGACRSEPPASTGSDAQSLGRSRLRNSDTSAGTRARWSALEDWHSAR